MINNLQINNPASNAAWVTVGVRSFLVGAFRRKTQTIAVTFFQDQRSDRFYKLTCTNTNCHTTSTGTWHRG